MELKNKRVLVVGLGKSGMAAALFLRDKGARVTVSDSRSAVALAGEIPTLLDAGIMVESGGHGLLTFRRQDLIVVSPGVPFDTPVSARPNRRHHRFQWQDDYDVPTGQNLRGCGTRHAGRRQYRGSGDRVDREEFGWHDQCPRGFELPVGDN
jgi:hypothetical protein